jgi:hypothetical protein
MPTALQIITRSMRIARVIGKGETLDADEAADGLTALNSMLNSWQTERLSVYQIREESFTWAANQQSRTVGSGGDFATDRPARVDGSSAFVSNSVDYMLGVRGIIDVAAWAAIPDKTTTSTIPWLIYPEYGTTLVTLYAYPIPSASITFKLRSWRALQSFAALTTSMDLPMGYEEALCFNLAESFGVEFGRDLTPTAQKKAVTSKANIKRINAPDTVMSSEAGYMNRIGWTGDIYADIAP